MATQKQRASVTSEVCVPSWQAAFDMEESARKTGLRIESVRARGDRFKTHGVPLKAIAGKGRPATDWAALKKLALELAKSNR